MRKVILQEFVSLDGLVAGPNNNVDFVSASTKGDNTFGREQLRLMNSLDTILLGRVTYEMFASHWPNIKEGEEKRFADKLNSIPRIVFSKTLKSAPWGEWEKSRIVKHDAAREVSKLKQQPGRKMIIWGSISVAHTLIKEGLIDEYRMVVCPIVLGQGRPLFTPDINSFRLKLVDAQTFELGAAQLKYKVERGGKNAGKKW